MTPGAPRGLASISAAITATAPKWAAAIVYLVAWVAPQQFAPGFVRALIFGLIIEFLVIHSFAFLQIGASGSDGGATPRRLKSILAVVGIGALYLIMAGALSYAMESWMPVWTFVWLIGGRVFEIVFGEMTGISSAPAADARFAGWLRSTALYFVGAIASAVLPLPALGVTPAEIARFELSGSGVWVDKPQQALAFGLVYFGVGAYLDLRARLRAGQ